MFSAGGGAPRAAAAAAARVGAVGRAAFPCPPPSSPCRLPRGHAVGPRAPASTRAADSAARPGKRKGAAAAGDDRKNGKLPKSYLFGFSCVEAALAANRRQLHKLYVRDNLQDCDVAKRTDYQRIREAVKLLRVPVEEKPADWLKSRSLDRPNQGVLLKVGMLNTPKIRCLNKARKGKPYSATLVKPGGSQANIGIAAQENTWPLWLALGGVVDPHEFGAIVRSAHFFGVDGIVVLSEDRVPFSPAASKASAGTLEVMPIHEADSLEEFLSASAEQNWEIVAAGGRTNNIAGRNLPQFPAGKSLESPTILVFGPERMRESVLARCRHELCVQGFFAHHAGGLQLPGTVCLTNSVAAACLLHDLTSRRDAGV